MTALTPDKYLSDTEVDRLLDHVRKASLTCSRMAVTDRLIVELLLATGIRAQELCDLRLKDLPLQHGKPCIWIRHGKGDVAAPVLIGKALQAALAEYQAQWRQSADPETPLFDNGKGGPMLYRTLYNKVVKIGKACGIDLHPHMLRHTYACRLYRVEKDLRFVQAQLRHSSPVTTGRYAQTVNEDGLRQLEKLDQASSRGPA